MSIWRTRRIRTVFAPFSNGVDVGGTHVTDRCVDENHYTADYPEDEVESDDEFGRDDYRYRTGNASDKEEFDDADEDEVVRSDDEAGLPGTRLWREQREVRSRLGLSKLKG